MIQKTYTIRSDFADEFIEKDIKCEEYDHIEKKSEHIVSNYITIHKDENRLNKPKGDYISVSFDNLHDREVRENVIECVIENMDVLITNMKIKLNKILVVGLGNRRITSDALGPRVIQAIIVTSHLIKEGVVSKETRDVAAIQPGVMGQTGLETYMIVESIKNSYEPDLIIVVDALATKNIERINRVVQINNTGIQPGSGVGNFRKAMNQKNLKVPIICIGVATITSVGAILEECLNANHELNLNIMDYLREQEQIDLVVTPKSMDDDIRYLSEIISESINRFSHPEYR